MRKLQEKLKERNYYQGKKDGIFGLNLENAVKNWQKDNFFQITGEIDYPLWVIIFQKEN